MHSKGYRACLVASPNTPRLTVAAIEKKLPFGSHLRLSCYRNLYCPFTLHVCHLVCGRLWQELLAAAAVASVGVA